MKKPVKKVEKLAMPIPLRYPDCNCPRALTGTKCLNCERLDREESYAFTHRAGPVARTAGRPIMIVYLEGDDLWEGAEAGWYVFPNGRDEDGMGDSVGPFGTKRAAQDFVDRSKRFTVSPDDVEFHQK